MMKLNIIIPNYNGRRFLSACLHSLTKQTFTDFDVIIVDNASSDDSIRWLSDNYPDVHIIALSENTGFAAAVNVGICHSKSPYIMVLNNDTILAPDCIANLICTMEKSAKIFSAGANVLTLKSPHLTDTNGDFYSIQGYAFCRSQGLNPSHKTSSTVFSNCGCAVIYRRSLLRRVGLFDKSFFAYLEDVDLGFRAKRLGFQNVHCPTAIVYHHGSGTTKAKYTSFKVYHSARNNIWLRKKNLTKFQRTIHAPFFFAGMIGKYIYFRKYHLHTYYRKGIIDGLRTNLTISEPDFRSFCRTEPWIWYGTFLYLFQYIKRRLLS